MARHRFEIHGTVQGVGFRWFVAREADRLGVRGWVANRPNGTVEVVAEGTQAVLAELEQALARGPRLARVERVDRSEISHDVTIDNTFHIL